MTQPHYPSWGLETFVAAVVLRYNERLPHYPSWGLETSDAIRGIRQALRAHYPSWGLETRSASARPRQPAFSSLPLMGIGNSFGNERQAAHHVLITPHGDWKRVQGRVSGFRSIFSLPLMGIGKRVQGRVSASVQWPSHYPSWGLETAPGPRTPSTISSASLPLMGIGNTLEGLKAQVEESSSLPLMGIGNLSIPCKPSCSSLYNSLPLMGIGNPTIIAPLLSVRDGVHAHYPSWGLETQLVPTGHRVRILDDSLPLMGIGNQRRRPYQFGRSL